jgi:uncharacterized membrane protein YeaQ/YmgE (transglycosylase-associated protein family)
MNFETIAITGAVGLLAGWLAGFVMKGGGYGLVGDIALGVVGGIVGGSVLGILGIATAGTGFAMVGAAVLGAAVLISAQRKFWNVDATATR